MTDDRDGRQCEGTLYLRHVPPPAAVQVHVLAEGHAVLVRADSIEVLAEDEVAVEELEQMDPLAGCSRPESAASARSAIRRRCGGR